MHLAFDRRARNWTLGALAGLLLAGPAAAQAPGQGAAPWAAPPAAAAPTQAPAPSERAARRGLHLGLVSGGAAFSAFRSQMVTAHLLDGDGAGDTERTFERLIAPETSTAAAVLATWWFSPRWAIRVGAAYAASSLSIRLEERDRRFLESNGGPGETSRYADLAVWLAEASALVTIGALPRRVEPYLLVGAGAVLYDPDESYGEPLPVGIRAVMAEQSRRIQPALVLGTGARIALEP
ncbi:MAG TPA: hypothetical protein VMK65_10475, partial [Longimicrobiales bacterium]|nr:hypothetical protein [Longimicrobiales bacterium]